MNDMKNLFVPYEIAEILKAKGFDEPCLGEWQTLKTGNNLVIDEENDRIYDVAILKAEIKAPLYQQVFKWFRETHSIDSWIEEVNHGINNITKKYTFQIPTPTSHLNKVLFFDTYEEAELACLKKLIEIINK